MVDFEENNYDLNGSLLVIAKRTQELASVQRCDLSRLTVQCPLNELLVVCVIEVFAWVYLHEIAISEQWEESYR